MGASIGSPNLSVTVRCVRTRDFDAHGTCCFVTGSKHRLVVLVSWAPGLDASEICVASDHCREPVVAVFLLGDADADLHIHADVLGAAGRVRAELARGGLAVEAVPALLASAGVLGDALSVHTTCTPLCQHTQAAQRQATPHTSNAKPPSRAAQSPPVPVELQLNDGAALQREPM